MIRVLFIFLLLLVSALVSGQDLSTTLEKYFQAVGGEQAISRVRGSKKELRVWLNLDTLGKQPGLDYNQSDTIYDISRLVDRHPCFEHAIITDGRSGRKRSVFYSNDKQNVNIIYEGLLREGIVVMHPTAGRHITVCESLDLLELKKSKKLTYTGVVEVSGKMYNRVKADFAFSRDYSFEKIYLFEMSSGLLEMTANLERPNELTRFYDHRWIDGILYPHRKEIYNGKALFYRELVDFVSFRPEIDDSVFYYNP